MEDTLNLALTPAELATVIEACRIARLFLGMVESTVAGAAGGADHMYRDLASISVKATAAANPVPRTVPVETKRRKK